MIWRFYKCIAAHFAVRRPLEKGAGPVCCSCMLTIQSLAAVSDIAAFPEEGSDKHGSSSIWDPADKEGVRVVMG